MSERIIRAALSAALVAGSAALVVGVARPASAVDLVAALPITSFGDIVVDGAAQRIYVSDPAAGKLITTDYAGTVKNTSANLPGIDGLLLSAAGDLYAAVPGLKSIVAFNQAGTRVETYTATSGDVRPATLAEAGGKIWFGEENGGLGRLDRSGEEPDLIPDLTTTTFAGAPVLAGKGGLVAAVDRSVAPATFAVVDVSTATPTTVVTKEIGAGLARDLAFDSDGSRLVAAGQEGLARALKPADLTTLQDYTAAGDRNAVAVRSDGVIAVGVAQKTAGAVSLFSPGSAAPTRQFALKSAGAGGTLQPGGLAWQPGGPRLFGVSTADVAGSGAGFALQIFADPAKLVTTVQLTAPVKLNLGGTATIAGVFAGPVPAGLPVTITRKDAAGSRRVGPTTVPANGRFQLTDKPVRSGTVTYTVAFAGNGDYSPATATRSFPVAAPRATKLSIDRNGSGFAYGTTVTLTAKLGATYSNRTVEIWADPFGGDQANRMVRKAAVNSKGVMTASFKVTRNTTFSAIFRGDAFTAPLGAKSTVSTRASVTTVLGRHYGTATIGGISYAVFRTSAHPAFATKLPPYPGRSTYQILEFYTGTQWKIWHAGFFPLNDDGSLYTELSGTHTAGVKYRIRAAYLYGKSGDTVNATAYGAHRYFTFTK